MSTAPVKKFSFAKPGAAAAVPVEPVADTAKVAAATPVTPVGDTASAATTPAAQPAPSAPQNLPATQPPSGLSAFYTGEEDEPVDIADIKLPRLNLVQKTSGAELMNVGKFGDLVLKNSIKLPQPVRIVVVGAKPKVWIEKVKYVPNGGGAKAKFARSEDEVVKLGGTTTWKFSKENAGSGSTKPWFQVSVTLLLLIEKPASLEDDSSFPFAADGKVYAAALTSVKSTNYAALFQEIMSEKATGSLRGGFNTKFIELSTKTHVFTGGESAVFVPKFTAEATSEEVRALCKHILGG